MGSCLDWNIMNDNPEKTIYTIMHTECINPCMQHLRSEAADVAFLYTLHNLFYLSTWQCL